MAVVDTVVVVETVAVVVADTNYSVQISVKSRRGEILFGFFAENSTQLFSALKRSFIFFAVVLVVIIISFFICLENNYRLMLTDY